MAIRALAAELTLNARVVVLKPTIASGPVDDRFTARRGHSSKRRGRHKRRPMIAMPQVSEGPSE